MTTPTITRQQYLRAPRAMSAKAHRDYYAQFVTDQTRARIRQRFTPEELERALAEDTHLNCIPLDTWDQLTCTPVEGGRFSRSTAQGNAGGRFFATLPFDREILAVVGETSVTRAFLVCVAKEAARQIAEGGQGAFDIDHAPLAA